MPARAAIGAQLALLGVIVVMVFAFAIWQTGRWQWGVGFGFALMIGFRRARGARESGLVAVRKNSRHATLPFAWRQGVANLYRPNNRTLLLLVSLGMGTFLMMTLFLSRGTLLGQLQIDRAGRIGQT